MLDFEAGSPLNSVACVNVTIIDDSVIEPDQSFIVSLSTMDPVLLAPISSAVVIIATDNDSKPVTDCFVCVCVRACAWLLALKCEFCCS